MIGTCNLRARNERIETGIGRESGEKSALRGKRDNAIGGKQLDSVQEETPVVSAAQVFVDRKAQSSSRGPRGADTDWRKKNPRKVSIPRWVSPSGLHGWAPRFFFFERNLYESFMFFWRPPVCQNYTYESGCQFGDKCLVRHTEAEGQPSKMSNKSGGLDQLLQWSLCSWVVCPKITLRESLFYVHVAPHCISGTKGSIARSCSEVRIS